MENNKSEKISKAIKLLTILVRVAVGATFIFSGFVKGVDPVGTAIKFQEYFIGLGIGILSPTSVLGQDFVSVVTLILSIMVSVIEFSIGVNILFGIYRKFTSWILLLFMLVMTPLTFYLAVANPVHDCGCFGEALVISNWTTFYKNLILLISAVLLVLFNNRYKGVYVRSIRWMPLMYSVVFIIVISVHSLRHQPFLDFRPYKSGVDINTLVEPRNFLSDYIFVYEKNGIKKEFTLDNYPASDTSWHFVDRKEVVIGDNSETALDFYVRDGDDDVTTDILEDTTYTFVLFVPSINKYDDSWQDRIMELYDYASENSYNFYCFSPDADSIKSGLEDTGISYPCYTMDQTTIETVLRGNPAIALIKAGRIYWKCSPRDLPDMSTISEPIDKTVLGTIHEYNMWKRVSFVSVLYLLPLLLIYLAEYTVIALVTKIRTKIRKLKEREDNK